ncbi:MarR family winged helix-turn-helix transcriptional regulator [Acidihalobacter prosperus]|uniref:HTH marR-type domain-containing protein n=1 Tax=Acidihalobacter prosperus TaxID=160660 RepID=A0A1A6C7Z0_9GAMM|nr:MarR family winged helix-turn-helix transcriptional regulator [Acidihalobacter prosperus]OBS10671.1 hypothetical protein Thpro_020387 [Acidihalobacter prosperus]
MAKTPGSNQDGIHALDFGQLTDLVGYRLRKAQIAAYQAFMTGRDAPGLTPGQVGVLILIDRNPALTQQALSYGIGVDKSTLVATLDRLSERGLIRRVRSSVDRRQNELRLTPKGQRTLTEALAYIDQHERALTARLSDDERATLLALLHKIG